VAPTLASIGKLTGTGAYPLARFVYNYFYLPTSIDVTNPSTWTGQYRAVLDYLDPIHGWLCTTTPHAADAIKGQTWGQEIAAVYKSDGFAAIKSGPVAGSIWSGNSKCRDALST